MKNKYFQNLGSLQNPKNLHKIKIFINCSKFILFYFILITQAHKKKLSVLGWRLYFSFVFFPAESESVVKSRGLTAYIEHNLKKLSKNHVSVEKLEKKRNIVSITSKTLSFYVFWLAE